MRSWMVLVVVGGIGCSSSSSSSSSTSSGSGGASDCAAFAQVACASYERCFPGFAKLVFAATNASQCESAFTQYCNQQSQIPDVTEAYATAACVNAMRDVQCGALFDTFNTTCGPSPGPRQPGASCFADEQCSTSYCRRYTPDGGTIANGCGVCTNKIASGQACATYEDCSAPGDCTNGVCVPYASHNGACDQDTFCDSNSDVCTNGTCQSAPALGESCTNGCAGPLQCTNMMCAGFNVVDFGQQCGFNGTDYVFCAGQLCEFQGDGGSLCQPPGDNGQACADSAGPPPCHFPLECINGTCGTPDPSACN